MPEHVDISTGEIHIPYNYSYATATAREAATGFAAGDVGKFARQTDDNSIWMLTAVTPTWLFIGGGGHSGWDFKQSCRVATTAAGTLASDYENGDTVDGVTLATGDRILIKDLAAGASNGIYVVAASGAPTRATDFDTSAEVTAGCIIPVTEGTTNGDKLFILTTNDTITLGTTALTFAQYGSTSGVAGPGSSTDNAVVRWDGTTGATIQNSVVTIADSSGNMAGVGTVNTHTIPGGTDTFAMLAASQALTNKTLTAPRIGTSILDTNGNELLLLTATGSAVNELTYANAATGNNPGITASGDDANVGIDLTPKATGTVNIKGNSTQAGTLRLYEDTDDGSNYTAFKVGTQAGNITYTLPTDDGDSGEFLRTDGSGVLSWEAASAGGGNIGDTVTGGTAGSVLFVATGPVLAQDNSNFYWDDSNNRLGIGTTSPAAPIQTGTTATGEKVLIYNDGSGNRYGLAYQTGYVQLVANALQVGSGNASSFTSFASFTSTGLFVGGSATSTDAQLQVHSSATNKPALQIRGADTHVTDVMLVREKIGGNEWTRQKVDTNFDWIEQTRNGAQSLFGTLSEEKTLSTGGATSDTTIQLPANSIILGVTARITTTISGVDSTTLQIGDSTTAARFGSTGTLTAGTTIAGLNHMQGGITTDATGPVQTSAAAVRLTLTGGADNTPSAGAVRVTIHYIQLVAPTS